MDKQAPLVSILIATYNRSQILKRAINSVLTQSFTNFELIIIDDASQDDTSEVVASFNDSRIRYIQNEQNVGSKKGDRAHVKRFVYELMKGKYFVYLCDDDYWLNKDLLKRQIAAFHRYENIAMVIGGQLSHFIPEGCELCLLPAKDASSRDLSLNGCFSWHNHNFAYIAPNKKIINHIKINIKRLEALLQHKLNNQETSIQNNTIKYFLTNSEISSLVKSNHQTIHIDLPQIKEIPHISYHDLHKIAIPRTFFLKNLYPKKVMTSHEFLKAFSDAPTTRNMIVGATLYSKKHFLIAGAMLSEKGSRWQAGYEFLMGPACVGNVVYLDEPAIVVEVRASNASFQGTQIDHYLDCLDSIDMAFDTPLQLSSLLAKRKLLNYARKNVIRNVTRSFINNSIQIKISGKLSACGINNMSQSVKPRLAFKKLRHYKILPQLTDLKLFILLQLPSSIIPMFMNPKNFIRKVLYKSKQKLLG